MKKKDNEVAVGIFVLVGFLLLTMILLFVSRKAFFRSGYSVYVQYGYVSILNKGAPVRMAGVRVGEVNDVRLFYDQTMKRSRVSIRLFIEKGVEIRENYEFKIQGTHILSEPHIEITPVSGEAQPLHDGSVVEGVNLVAVEDLIDKAHEIMGGLNSSVNGSGGGLRASMKNIESSSESLSDILGKVRQGNGTVGKLLMTDDLYNEMDALVKDVRAHPWKLLKKDSASKRKWYFLYLF
jgi:phospholipid/cholesterol/gamma-HCH transport system substrate-binding protein